jgi:arylformamidase
LALKLTNEEIATLSPLRLPIVQKQLTIACDAAELPALVWDSKKFYDARKAAGTPGELVVIGGADHFHHPGRITASGSSACESRAFARA